MTRRTLALAFVMDPIGSLPIATDTTFVLMLEAQRRGHRLFYLAPGDLGAERGNATAQVHPVVALRREAGRHVELGPARASGMRAGASRSPRASRKASTRSLRSQPSSVSVRPKWP